MELVFDTKGMDEEAYSAYATGVVDALDKLGIDFEWDEFNSDCSEYRVKLSEQGEKVYHFAQDLVLADAQQAQAEVEGDEHG